MWAEVSSSATQGGGSRRPTDSVTFEAISARVAPKQQTALCSRCRHENWRLMLLANSGARVKLKVATLRGLS